MGNFLFSLGLADLASIFPDELSVSLELLGGESLVAPADSQQVDALLVSPVVAAALEARTKLLMFLLVKFSLAYSGALVDDGPLVLILGLEDALDLLLDLLVLLPH